MSKKSKNIINAVKFRFDVENNFNFPFPESVIEFTNE
jgi:hypothetical protein